MNDLAQIPALEYVADSRSKDYRHILADGVPIYRVTNEAEFNSAMGFSPDVNEGGRAVRDEYIWSESRRTKSPTPKECLQVRMFLFVCSASDRFQESYASLRKMLMGSCLSDAIDNDDDHCVNCLLHPRFAY